MNPALIVVLLLGLPQAQDWIQQLGSEDPEVRERAGSRLLEQGETSRKPLEEASARKDVEIASRARRLLARLNERRFSGGLGKTGAFWADPEALALLADAGGIPDSIKPLLHDEAEATFAIVRVEAGRARLQDILTARVTALTEAQAARYGYTLLGPDEREPKLLRHFAHGRMDTGFEVNEQRTTWDYGWHFGGFPYGDWWNPSDVRRPGDLFRVWPDLKAASIVFVAPSDAGRSLQKGLLEALAHPRRDVRLAATAALGKYFTFDAVQGLLGLLRDPDAGVVDAAADTLKKIARAPKGTAAEVREWWSKLKEADRKELLMACLADGSRNLPPGIHYQAGFPER